MINLNGGLSKQYLAECQEHLAVLEADLVSLEVNDADEPGEIDEARLNSAFEAVHSVRRGADFFDFARIDELANRTEDVVSLIRSRKMAPTHDRIGILLRATDRLLELVRNSGSSNQADITAILTPLNTLYAEFNHENADEQPLRVLLVEDDFSNRLLLQTFLSRYGECHVAVNGKEAVAAFRKAQERGRQYDLVCMDIMMPEMDGREAVRQIRALEEARGIFSTHGAKIIMTTAVNDFKEVSRCFGELCDAYLTKPIDLRKLLNHMKAWELVV